MDDRKFTPGPLPSSGPRETVNPETDSPMESARREAAGLKEDAKNRVRSAAQEQRHFAAESIDTVARALRRSGEELEKERQTHAARYVNWAADGLAQMSDGLREKDLHAVVNQTEDFARRQPALFFGSAVTVGFLLARFLKSSRPEPTYRPSEI